MLLWLLPPSRIAPLPQPFVDQLLPKEGDEMERKKKNVRACRTSQPHLPPSVILTVVIPGAISPVRVIAIPTSVAPHLHEGTVISALKRWGQVLVQLAVDVVPPRAWRPRLVAQVKGVGVVQGPVEKVDEVSGPVDEEGVWAGRLVGVSEDDVHGDLFQLERLCTRKNSGETKRSLALLT
jgi:hypothetical protein